MEIDSGERRADLMHRAPDGERSKIDSGEAGAVDQLDDHPLRFLIVAGGEDDGAGFCFEKSCIHAMGMLLIDFTSRAPGAISATISLDVRPLSAARDRVTPARLMSGLASTWALVVDAPLRLDEACSEQT